MKKIFSSSIFILLSIFGFTQQLLPVSTNKTVTLIFPFPVVHYDHGSNEVLVQQVSEATNILLIKAATAQMQTTSLTIVCGDGNVYPFKVQYDSMPAVWVWTVAPVGEANINTYAISVLDNPAVTHHPTALESGMSIGVTGIYVRDEVMYFQLSLKNDSPIDYNVDDVQFFIRDEKKSRRTASQEISVRLLSNIGNFKLVRANSNNNIVIAIGSMTLHKNKYLCVQLLEKNGGRNLLLKIKNRHLMNAIALPGIH